MAKLKALISELVYPRKCIFCRKLLSPEETDLCRKCRENAPEFHKSKIKFSFVARWTAVWYYKDDARKSILRYKFAEQRCYGPVYGRLLAMKLQKENMDDFDVLTWVPVSWQRRFTRGYDQVKVIAQATAKELQVQAVPSLKKIRNTKPQSRLKLAAQRRANVLGAYRVMEPERIRGKRILLLDDIVTTGATASECAKTLLTAGAKEVQLATLAVAAFEKK